jgi:hypothetical protein
VAGIGIDSFDLTFLRIYRDFFGLDEFGIILRRFLLYFWIISVNLRFIASDDGENEGGGSVFAYSLS